MATSMTKWLALREAVPGLSGREVERRLGWKSGYLSLIERGLQNPEREEQLRRFYAELLLAPPEPTIDAAAS